MTWRERAEKARHIFPRPVEEYVRESRDRKRPLKDILADLNQIPLANDCSFRDWCDKEDFNFLVTAVWEYPERASNW